MKRNSQRGVALILTLILLSVITFLAVAFLALSRRERAAVTITIDQTRARQAVETAAERAKAQVLAQLIVTTNKWAYDLGVSTNFINYAGYKQGLFLDFRNVNYDYKVDGSPLTEDDQEQNIANLYYDPRPPVFVRTNPGAPLDFRFYLDLNRNGRCDTNGWWPVFTRDDAGVLRTNGQAQFFVGDPEWLGQLSRLDLAHSELNRFISRYAYLIQPVGKQLDWNYIHNQAKWSSPQDVANEGFFRNQGVGPWELNLAAALEDLNTNVWAWGGNNLDPTLGNRYSSASAPSTGPAFLDALALLRYRYNGSFFNLSNMVASFGAKAGLFQDDLIDQYANGPLQTGLVLSNDNDLVSQPWSGAETPNAFFTTQDLFDTNKTSFHFTNALAQAGTNDDSYSRYTYYNLLSTLGTGSGPEPPDYQVTLAPDQAPPPKLNLNYVNLHGSNVTDLASWTPVDFFTNAADRLLRDVNLQPYPGLNVGWIPVWPTNYYTPAVHRLLQVSANLYDATTTNELPSVFRPFFRNYGTNIVIVGYGAVTNLEVLSATNRDLAVPSERASLQANDLVYGIPLVIGAKKGLPNFNEFALQTFVQATRKLQFVKASVGAKPFQTNQMFILGISNVFGVEAWNSYRLPYPRPLQLQVGVDLTGVLTNETGILWSNRLGRGVISNILAGTWPGAAVNAANRTYLANETNSLKVPLQTGYWFLTNSAYLQKSTGGGVIGNLNPAFAVKGAGFPIPILGLTLTARLRFVLVDAQFTPNRIVDYVNLADLTSYLDITSELAGPDPTGQDISVALWDTNRVGNSASVMAPTRGIMQQISISMGGAAADSIWTDYNATTVDKAKSIAAFSAFLLASPSSTELVKQTPFNPVRLFSLQNTWQANDPLVHYQPGDLADLVKGTNDVQFYLRTAAPNVLANLGRLNQRCNPWGGNPDTSTKTDPYNLALKDPQVRRSDDWEFPASKFPSLGWLGRVHRGTPWQTVYMKSPDLATTPLAGKPTAWQTWSGNRNLGDANYARPIADRALFEHFSTALSPNSTRGQLSVNNDNLAAWSAVLACVCVLSNNVPDAKFNDPYQLPQFSAEFIKPAGEEGWNSALGAIVQGIHRTRTNATLFPRQVFSTLGQILAVPELTTNSPFLNTNTIQLARGITDAAYERIPQQILSLLRGDDDPRFVIYAFGQALRPAENSLVQAGPLIRLCTNYAVTAESASRTVVRIVDAPTPAYPNRKPRVLVESFNYLPTD